MSNSTAWWPTVPVLGIACFIVIRSRRIPNGLVLPFGLAGLIVSILFRGVAGLENSLAGVGLAALVCGIFCHFRGLGMGDLKLSAAIGAWIAPAQPGFAWSGTFGAGVLTGMLGKRYTNTSLRSLAIAGDLLPSFGGRGCGRIKSWSWITQPPSRFRTHRRLRSEHWHLFLAGKLVN